jgi:tRNA modification GTPase
MNEIRPTNVCLLSPLGRSAVAMIGVVGPSAKRVVESQFYPAAPALRSPQGNLKWSRETEDRLRGNQEVTRILFGRWGGLQGEEVVVCRRLLPNAKNSLLPNAKNSCAEAQYVEVHGHGGQQAAQRILDSLVAENCQVIRWEEWTRLQSLNLLQAEARIGLAAAMTQRTAAILLDQYQGALRREIEGLKEQIVTCHDNPDRSCTTPAKKITALLSRLNLGSHLTRPWQILLAGRPNVGKSSLMNALVGYTRSIVFDQPGTTRDILSATTAMAGWPVQLNDTAGLHEASDPLELQGIRRALEQFSQTDLLVWVLDWVVLSQTVSAVSFEEVWRLAQQEMADVRQNFPKELPILIVLNKVDLAGKYEGATNGCGLLPECLKEAPFPSPEFPNPEFPNPAFPSLVPTSATTGEGVELLVATMVAHLVPHPPTAGEGVPFNDRQQQLLQQASCQLQQANLQQAIATLDEVLG